MILNKNICETSREGFYVSISFKSDMSTIYLSIKLDNYAYIKTLKDEFDSHLKNDRNYLQNKIKNKFINNPYFNDSNNVAYYDKSWIIAKEYSKQDLISKKVNIENELNEIIKIYEYLINEEILISIETWKTLLHDESIFNKEMLYILNTLLEHEPIDTEKLSNITKIKFPNINEENLYKLINYTGQKIQNKINGIEIIGFKEKLYWRWLLNGKKTKTGHIFELKENLKLTLKENNIKDENMEKDKNFYQYLMNKGYYFDKEIIENFLLSIKVKPFIIFTGNSGTGKTKLAQLFAQYINHEYGKKISVFTKKVVTSKSSSNKAFMIDGYAKYKIIDPQNDRAIFPINVNGIEGEGRLEAMARLNLTTPEIRDYLNDYYEKNYNEDTNPKPEVDIEIILDDNNNDFYKIIPVGSNWTDNRNILGYYNVITEKYHITPAFKLIMNAQKHGFIPHFLVLDEMNLSHVERYFADYLSSIESGEKIPLYSDQNEKITGINEDGEEIDVPKELKLPNNLITIGTVNVDETTYMFSPKVLDRANTIEFPTQSANDYMKNNLNIEKPNGNLSYLEDPLSDLELKNYTINELKNYLNNNKLWDNLSNELDKFQSILAKSSFDFGFRVINEIILFMIVAYKYENENKDFNWERYFDAQIKQKILPKLHGSERSIGNTLNDLFKLCMKNNEDIEDIENIQLTHENTKYYTSALKLQKMIQTLINQKYVSFIN